jgi:hypothetical protein
VSVPISVTKILLCGRPVVDIIKHKQSLILGECGSLLISVLYKKQHGARPCVEKMQLNFFVPPNEEAKPFFFCLTLGQTGSGVLSDSWSLCLSHHFFLCNVVYNLSNFVLYTELNARLPIYSHDH